MNAKDRVINQNKPSGKQWYNLRPLLGHASWGCWMYILLGARECGVCPRVKVL